MLNVTICETLQYSKRYSILNVTKTETLRYAKRYSILNVTKTETLRYAKRYDMRNVTKTETLRYAKRYDMRNVTKTETFRVLLCSHPNLGCDIMARPHNGVLRGRHGARVQWVAKGSGKGSVQGRPLSAPPRTTHHAPRTTHHAPRTTHHAPRTTHHAPRTTHTSYVPMERSGSLETARKPKRFKNRNVTKVRT
jgi:hypothetical protein